MQTSIPSSEERFSRFAERDAALVRWRFGRGYVAELARGRYHRMFHGARRILDVGCGVGQAAIWADGADYTGIDLSESLIRQGAVEKDRHLAVADVTCLPFTEASFDRVTCMGVLHHLPQNAVPAALAEMARVLQSRGEMVIIEPNPWNPFQRLFAWLRPPERGILHTSPRDLRRAIDSVPGVSLVSAEFEHTMPLPAIATFMLRRWRWPTGPRMTRLLSGAHCVSVALRPRALLSHTFWRLRKD